jgi:ERO1-like protein beta
VVSDTCASYETIEQLNTDLAPSLQAITQTTDFFAYYRLNLLNNVCPFWNDANSMCGNIACAVNTIEDEAELPPAWRPSELGKLEGPKAHHPGKKEQKEREANKPLQGSLGDKVGESCVLESDDECDDRDYCVPEDESATAKGDYVSLLDNPERFTGYSGDSAHMVWDSIYSENCFSKSVPTTQQRPKQAANDLRSVLQANAPSTAFMPDDTCVEKRVFHRIISGMHASISTHICADYLDHHTGQWGPNLTCYQDRLAPYPDRISNLYFNYALVLRALAKLKPLLSTYTFCSGDPVDDRATRAKVVAFADKAAAAPAIFHETFMFTDPGTRALKEDFRNRFRNVSRLMDCVGCDKCRLWGKLQTSGYGTALKVLFEMEDGTDARSLGIKRTELVALVNTFDRIGHSLSSIVQFRAMQEEQVQSTSRPAGPMTAKEAAQAEASRVPASNKSAQRPSSTPSNNAPSSHSPRANEVGPDDDDDAATLPSVEGGDDAMAELYHIYRVAVWVLDTWLRLPKRLATIGLIEATRLWAFWLGLEAPEREWHVIDWESLGPRRDEL